MATQCVVFRADAGLKIGIGHVMRCLTLADELRSKGCKTIIVSRDNHANGLDARGHEIRPLPGNTNERYGQHISPPYHASWLGADWRGDAALTRSVLEEAQASWLVVDHYALDASWQKAALPKGIRLLVLDDLADRPHLADMLVDQNLGRTEGEYRNLVPENCELRVGPLHALLRPEFAKLRLSTLKRRQTLPRPKRLLVTLGGIDKNNGTSIVLRSLAKCPIAKEFGVDVIMGKTAPHIDMVKFVAAEIPIKVKVFVGVQDMAERMSNADLCIGAAGSTAWERCALGLPTLQIVLAENQVNSAKSMADQGIAWTLPNPEESTFQQELALGIERLTNRGTYGKMVDAAASITDGFGCERLAQSMCLDLNGVLLNRSRSIAD